MRCFYHHDMEALGVCKNCNRGICEACLVDVDDHGLACRERCEAEVRQVHALIERNKNSYKNIAHVQIRNAYAFGIFAIVLFVLYGIGQFQTNTFLHFAGGGLIFLGLFFLAACIMNIFNARRFLRR